MIADGGIDRIPPHNLDAERAVLGASLIDRDALMVVIESLAADDFYEPRNKIAFEIIYELAMRDRAVDSLTFNEEAASRSMMERLGGEQFTTALIDAVTTTANIEHHCEIVRDKSVHRGLIRVGHEIVHLGFSEDVPLADALEGAERSVFELSKRGSSKVSALSKTIHEALKNLESRLMDDSPMTGVPSGFADLDKITGGFQRGSLNIVAARPSMGKTAFALNIAQHAAMNANVLALIFSMEMTAEQIALRLLSSEAQVNIKQMMDGNYRDDQWKEVELAAAKLSGSNNIFIDDTPGLTTQEIRSSCRKFFSKHPGRRGIVVVDYIQIMDSMRKNENRQQEVSEISRGLKGLAREFDVPVIALSQLSRAVESRENKRPMLSDLRESGAIEQDADLVAFLYRPAYYQQEKDGADNTAEVGIAKHRNGPTGKVELVFFSEYARFGSKDFRQSYY